MWLQNLQSRIFDWYLNRRYKLKKVIVVDGVQVRFYWKRYKVYYFKRFVIVPLMFKGELHNITREYKIKKVHGAIKNKNRRRKRQEDSKAN